MKYNLVVMLSKTVFAAAFVVGVFSQSLECYERDENGDLIYYNGEVVVANCQCDANELSSFVRHVGNECFNNGGLIPAEIYEGFYSGCNPQNQNPENNNNNNNNNNQCEEAEDAEEAFWCKCLGDYLKKYGSFPEGCRVPMLSQAMEAIADQSLENAWEENGCTWFDFENNRVIPKDVAVAVGTTGTFSVETNENTWASSINLQFDLSDVQEAYLAATGNNLQCDVDENGDNNNNNNNQNQEPMELAWEIRRGIEGAAVGTTNYGADCNQGVGTGDVLVSYVYPTEIDDDGNVQAGEREIYIADMTERMPLVANNDGVVGYPYVCGQYDENKECENNNNNNNNNNNDQQESVEEQAANLSSVFAFQLYNQNDVDTYSLVISCQDEAQNNNNNNNNNQEEECAEFDGEKEACESRVTKYAIPIMCTSFAVEFDGQKSDDNTDECQPIEECQDKNGLYSALYPTQQECEGAAQPEGVDEWDGPYKWVVTPCDSEFNQDDNDNGIPDGEEETNGYKLISETEDTIKNIAIAALSICLLGSCVYAWKKGGSGGYDAVKEQGGDQL